MAQRLPADVNSLSNEQISQYWNRAQEQGVSLEELRAYAIANGASASQANTLMTRVNNLAAATSNESESEPSGTPVSILVEQLRQSDDERKIIGQDQQVYGMNVFSGNNQRFSPSSSTATPKNYILGSGDKIVIQIYGTSQRTYNLTVTNEGKVIVPLIGPVSVAGFSIDAAQSLLEEKLSEIYSGLASRTQTVFLELTVSEARSISVNVIGEVANPGNYQLSAFSSPFTALYASGGPTERGTLRDIKLFRSGKLISTVDVYQYLTLGKLPEKNTLIDGDILVVGTFKKHVSVGGKAKITSLFELIEGEGLTELIQLAGGFAAGAFEDVLIVQRLLGSEQMVKDIPIDSDFELQDGDRVLVKTAKDPLVEKIQIQGAVLRQGSYGWFEGVTLGQLLEVAGGLTPEAYRKHITLFRKREDLSTITETIDLTKEAGQLEMKLSTGDLVIVPSRFDLQASPFIEISGKVLSPGILPYFEGMTISDALVLSSGLENETLGGEIELVRRPENVNADFELWNHQIIDQESAINDPVLNKELLPNDHIIVRQSDQFIETISVEILGEVAIPGYYALRSRDTRVSELLERCGGLTQFAFLEGAHILRSRRTLTNTNQTKAYLQRLEKLNIVLNQKLSGGTLSTVEKDGLELRLEKLREEYRRTLVNEGINVGDSISFWTIDSVYTELRSAYDKVPFRLELVLNGDLNNENDLILQNGDKLIIPSVPQTVEVYGEVLNGNTVATYQSNFRVDDYIGTAGGFTSSAKRSKAYVLYMNGSVARTRRFLFFRRRPEIIPGAKIIVPGGRLQNNIDIDRVFGLLSTAATTYLLFLTVRDRSSN